MPTVLIILSIVGVIFLLSVARVMSFYTKAPQGKAIIRTGQGGIKVSFNGIWVMPVIHKMEIMDISIKEISIERIGKESIITNDSIRVDLKILYFLRIQPNAVAIKTVARNIGTEKAADLETIQGLFEAKFTEIMKTVAKDFPFLDILNSREEFRRKMEKFIHSEELNGFELVNLEIETLEMTPKSFYDPDNILDHHGLKRLEELKNEKFD